MLYESFHLSSKKLTKNKLYKKNSYCKLFISKNKKDNNKNNYCKSKNNKNLKNYMKNVKMSKIDTRKSFRYLIGGCTKGASLTVTAPLKIPSHWTRVLRLAPGPKIRPDELLQVFFFSF